MHASRSRATAVKHPSAYYENWMRAEETAFFLVAQAKAQTDQQLIQQAEGHLFVCKTKVAKYAYGTQPEERADLEAATKNSTELARLVLKAKRI